MIGSSQRRLPSFSFPFPLPTTCTMSTKFDSEGFDLSPSSPNDINIIYEIGGTTTTDEPIPSSTDSKESSSPRSSSCSDEPTAKSEQLKEQGNAHFRAGNHLDAYDYYTDAIEAAPYGEGVGLTGEELLRLKDEFDELQRETNAARHRAEMDRRRNTNNNNNNSSDKDEKKEENQEDTTKPQQVQEFTPPKHIYGHKLAIYYANRAATLLHMGRLDETINDCTIAILYNPFYAKAYIRRGTAHERNDDTEAALLDIRRAYELQPGDKNTKKSLDRLEKLEKERLEKLKEETMDKLKDLGNSILGNFGLSLDNFQAVQDPKTGGYSISFNQNK